MTKFLVTTMPFHSHINTSASIVARLIEKGHEVWWYTGRKYQAKVEATGARFVPFQAAPDFDDANISATYPEMGKLKGMANMKYMIKHVVVDAVPGQIKDLLEINRTFRPEIVLADQSLFGAGWFHELGGPVWAAYGHFPLSISSRDTAPFGLALPPSSTLAGRLRNKALYGLIKNLLLRDCTEYINRVRASVGLRPQNQLIMDTCISPYLFLQGTVPGFEYLRSDLPSQVHFVGPFLPLDALSESKLPEWWPELEAGGRPVVHVTQGTLAADPKELIIPTIEALAGMDLLVVATTGGHPLETVTLKEHPANLRLEKFIPHSRLLPFVDVMVTNAGYGGVQIALSHGVPLVAAGATEDKPEVASRIAWSGVGINLKTATPKPAQIRAAVEKLLAEPAYRAKAQSFKAEFAAYSGPVRAVQLLEQLAATKQPVRNDVMEETKEPLALSA
ncbi:MAG TPA: nucleotide disphospho-sugar-binding domain-containing protein [Chloroflexia bacterium]|nr:nucleotide disphospho-sugar-binding domain-containing protein [Chloroflexia bacterium]